MKNRYNLIQADDWKTIGVVVKEVNVPSFDECMASSAALQAVDLLDPENYQIKSKWLIVFDFLSGKYQLFREYQVKEINDILDSNSNGHYILYDNATFHSKRILSILKMFCGYEFKVK